MEQVSVHRVTTADILNLLDPRAPPLTYSELRKKHAPNSPPPHPASKLAKILIYDIETLPNRGFFFQSFSDRPIALDFIEKERSICTIAYKWLGDDDAQVISIADFPTFSDPYDDRELLKAFLPVWEQAQYTVAHYGDKFDLPFIAGRLMINKLPALAPVCQIDTYKLAKKFNLNSRKLDYLGTILGLGNKNKTSASLWVRCAQGDPEAILEMAAYNQQDVQLLEAVFVQLLGHVRTKINLNLFVDDPVVRCKSCGSDQLEQKGYELTAASIRHRFRCLACGAWSAHRPKK